MTIRITRRTFLLASTTMCLNSALPVWACGKGTVKIRKKEKFENIDPCDFKWDDEPIMRNVLAPPFRRDNSGDMHKHLANNYSMEDDNKTVIVRLRSNELWSNGANVRAKDFEFSLKRIIDKEHKAKHRKMLENVKSVETLDRDHVKINLKSSDEDFVKTLLTGGVGCVIRKEGVEALDKKRFSTKPPGTSGRYKIIKHIPEERVDLSCDSNWHGEKPEYQKAEFHIIKRDDNATAALKRGRIDFMDADDANLYRTGSLPMLADSRFRVIPADSGVSYYLGFNLANKEMQNLELRSAINSAVSGEAVNRFFRASALKPLNSIFPSLFSMPAREPAIHFQPDDAREFFRQASNRIPRMLNIWVSPRASRFLHYLGMGIGQLLQDISVKVQIDDKTEYQAAVGNSYFHLYVWAVSAAYISSLSFAKRLLSQIEPWIGTGLDLKRFNSDLTNLFQISDGVDRKERLMVSLADLEKQGGYRVLGERRRLWIGRNDIIPHFSPYGTIGDLGEFRRG